MRILSISVKAIALVACTGIVMPPVISDISSADSLVRVQARNAGNYWTPKWPKDQDIMEEGQKGCELFKRPAVMLSFRCVEIQRDSASSVFDFCKMREYLFACRIE